MFSGSVRRNLDPFSEQSDGDLWTALASVGLKPAIEAMQVRRVDIRKSFLSYF